jgi:hypothetical protein
MAAELAKIGMEAAEQPTPRALVERSVRSLRPLNNVASLEAYRREHNPDVSTRVTTKYDLKQAIAPTLVDTMTGKILEQRPYSKAVPEMTDEEYRTSMASAKYQAELGIRRLRYSEKKQALTQQATSVQEVPEVITAEYITSLITQLRELPKEGLKQFERVINMLPWQVKTVVFAVIVAGCASGKVSPIPSETTPSATTTPSTTPMESIGGEAATGTPTLKVSPSPTEAPTAAPTGFEQTGSGIVWHGTNNETGTEINLNVPDLSKYGLKAELKDGMVIYVDTKGNRAGEFNPYVTEQQTDGSEVQTGALGLKSSAVSKLITEQQSTIPAGQDKVAIPVPVSLSGMDLAAAKTAGISIKYTTGYGTHQAKIAEIDFTGEQRLTNPLPGKQIFVFQSSYYGWAIGDASYRLSPPSNNNNINPDHAQSYIQLSGEFEGVTSTPNKSCVLGDYLYKTTAPITIGILASNSDSPVTYAQMLHFSNSLVFLDANS